MAAHHTTQQTTLASPEAVVDEHSSESTNEPLRGESATYFDLQRLPGELQLMITDRIADNLISSRVYCHGGSGDKTPPVLLTSKTLSRPIMARLERFERHVSSPSSPSPKFPFPAARTVTIPLENETHLPFFTSPLYRSLEADPHHTIRIVNNHVCCYPQVTSNLPAAEGALIVIIEPNVNVSFRGQVQIEQRYGFEYHWGLLACDFIVRYHYH